MAWEPGKKECCRSTSEQQEWPRELYHVHDPWPLCFHVSLRIHGYSKSSHLSQLSQEAKGQNIKRGFRISILGAGVEVSMESRERVPQRDRESHLLFLAWNTHFNCTMPIESSLSKRRLFTFLALLPKLFSHLQDWDNNSTVSQIVECLSLDIWGGVIDYFTKYVDILLNNDESPGEKCSPFSCFP